MSAVRYPVRTIAEKVIEDLVGKLPGCVLTSDCHEPQALLDVPGRITIRGKGGSRTSRRVVIRDLAPLIGLANASRVMEYQEPFALNRQLVGSLYGSVRPYIAQPLLCA